MPRWTAEARKKQSLLLQRLRPWEKSTGPRTVVGKAISRNNAFKSGIYSAEVKAMYRALYDARQRLKAVTLLLRCEWPCLRLPSPLP